MRDIKELEGKIFSSVENVNNEELIFTCEDGTVYKFYHAQDCCESVGIEDIYGDLSDLVGTPVLLAEEVSNEDYEKEWLSTQNDNWLSYTWTFYKFATQKGYVDVRWLGESNGYYSESVDFMKVGEDYEY